MTYGLFRAQGLTLRIIFVTGSIGWFVHNAVVGSWGGMTVEAGFARAIPLKYPVMPQLQFMKGIGASKTVRSLRV